MFSLALLLSLPAFANDEEVCRLDTTMVPLPALHSAVRSLKKDPMVIIWHYDPEFPSDPPEWGGIAYKSSVLDLAHNIITFSSGSYRDDGLGQTMNIATGQVIRETYITLLHLDDLSIEEATVKTTTKEGVYGQPLYVFDGGPDNPDGSPHVGPFYRPDGSLYLTTREEDFTGFETPPQKNGWCYEDSRTIKGFLLPDPQ